MAFNSLEFLLFFPVIAWINAVLPAKIRWPFLLGASYLFLMSWKVEYLCLILISTGVAYLTAISIEREAEPNVRRWYLWMSILINLGLLTIFKYSNFINDNVRMIFAAAGANYPIPDLQIKAPLGISFYTLQVVGYSIDVYYRRVKAEPHLGIFATFVAFFPQLAAGPIERAKHMLPQFKASRSFEYERVVNGSLRILWGFFKKLVIADRLRLLVNTVYDTPTIFTGNPLIWATYAFAFQIYCDFSAYSDIAIGAAAILGFKLTENFQQPYYSKSIGDFWRNWHISLSTWLRDYIFYPLRRYTLTTTKSSTGNLTSLIIPPMLTMLISGLWHGAGWTFIAWGLIHGLLIVVETAWAQNLRNRIRFIKLPESIAASLRICVTFHLICFTWIFFRANSLADAFYIIGHLFVGLRLQLTGIGALIPGGKYQLSIALCAILLMELIQIMQRRHVNLRAFALRQPIWIRWAAYYALVLIILMFGKFGLVEFFYIQF
jgi:alginate O-acetyltransferase complex protein AlgI